MVTPPVVTLSKDVKPNSWSVLAFPNAPLKVVTFGVSIVPTLLIVLQVEKKFDMLVAALKKLAVGKRSIIPDCSNMLFTSVQIGNSNVFGKCSPSKLVVKAKK